MKKKIFAFAVAVMAVMGAQAQDYLDMEISSLPNLKWATEDISGSRTFSNSEVNWGGKWRFPTLEEWKNLLDACSQSYDSTTKTLTLKYYGKILTFKDVEEGTIYWAGDEPYAWITNTYDYASGQYVTYTTYYPSYVKFKDSEFDLCRGQFEGYVDKVTISNTNGRVRPVATMGKVVISDIPDGWTVNGMAPTDGKVSVDAGSKLTVVPGQTPGKKIKSIRLEPITE